jgi:2,4-dienoyl-CoA reductase-like NADH-dependent reductase (Old Yellow Enzyme family)
MADGPLLFQPLTFRDVTLRNRIAVSPMCQYSCRDGLADDWHLVHLGSRAIGGAGLVMVEATAVEARGRITPHDLGIWSDAHVEPLARVARFVAEHGAVPGIQLAHAGRKASRARPWDAITENGVPVKPDALLPLDDGGWTTIAPSALPYYEDDPPPHALSLDEIAGVQRAFAAAALSARQAGFRLVELHGAHGYLIHEFLSPKSNQRTDAYGGTLENRARFLIETVRAVRRTWPADLPLFVRLSCTDYVEGGFDLEEALAVSRMLKDEGVDLVDCSSGGNVRGARIDLVPGYQVPFAAAIRERAGIATAAVGLVTDPAQAEAILRENKADLVLLAREMLRDPYWPVHAAKALGVDPRPLVPAQYRRAY